ncbi:MAG: ComEC/Rec2 family competence protein [Chthoniobacteraceae bacterium]
MSGFPPTPRLPLIGLAAWAIAGIVISDRWLLPLAGCGAALIVLGAITLLWPRTAWCWIFTGVAFATLHSARYQNHPARQLVQVLESGPRVVKATGIVWDEPRPAKFWSGATTGYFRMKVEQLEVDDRPFIEDEIVNVSWAGPLPRYGDRVRLIGSAENIEPVRNPGQFDSANHLRRQGIYSQIQVRFPADAHVEGSGHGETTQRFAIAARHWFADRLGRDLEDAPEIRSLIASMVLGMRATDTPEEMQEVFRRTGTLHLFAVSGLNTAMLGFIALFVLKALGLPRRIAVFLTVPILAAYALVTGLSPSCVRAAIMTSLILIGWVIDRRVLVFNSLAGAAVIILALDTNQLFTAGFQFSFVLVATIVWLSRKIERPIARRGRPDEYLPKALWNRWQKAAAFAGMCLAASLGVTLSAWLGSLVFTAGYFHLFSASAIFANMLAVPLAFCVLALGLASALSSLVSSVAGILFNNANYACAQLLLGVVHFFAVLPGGHYFVELPGSKTAPGCEIMVLDVSGGGAIHVRSGGEDWLIDTGPLPLYPRITLPYLRSRGVNRLDALLLTHGDARHLGAAEMVLEDFSPRAIFDSPLRDKSSTRRAIHQVLSARNQGKGFLSRGDTLAMGSATIVRVLYPPTGMRQNNSDDKALVLLLESSGWKVLFSSDAGFITERYLIENEPDLRADVLVKGWHARDFSGTGGFLARVSPSAVICEAPDYSADATERRAWYRAVEDRGIVLFAQEKSGSVNIQIDADELVIRGFVEGLSVLRRNCR